jgi:uncharacterized protein
MSHQYRIIEDAIRQWMFKGKVIVITGARQVGKTTFVSDLLAKQTDPILALNADLPADRKALEDPSLPKLRTLIGKNKILFIDEVQRVENCGLLLKIIADNFKNIQVIATGSSALEISESIFEPLTGRHYLFHLYPFALKELYDDKSPFDISKQFSFHLIYGMYPEVCLNRDSSEMILKNLSAQYLYKDVLVWKDIRKPDLLEKLLQLLAFQMGSEVSIHELAMQLKVKSETIENYIDLLEKSFVVYRLKSYSTNERKEVSKMRKILFWDNGIRNAVLGDFRAPELRSDAGALWENFMISERMKLNAFQSSQAKSFFWRSLAQQEVDYVEVLKGKISGWEMKWNASNKKKLTKAFTNLYPKAKTAMITPDEFGPFCGFK